MVEALRTPTREVNIALVGKYISLHDAYISVVEALSMAESQAMLLSIFTGSIQKM